MYFRYIFSPKAYKPQTQGGFSLIQMAILLIIIGFIVGVIVTGAEMKRQSELQSIAADVKKFNAAIYQFQTQYGAMPGDLTTATTYWGTNPNCATYGAGTGTQTCNGNGNGQIDANGNGSLGEEYYAWQQLANAGLIPSSYTGASTTSLPKSKVNNGYYRVSYQTGVYLRNGHMISINTIDSTDNIAHNAILSAQDVYSMDKKFDDGQAPTGDIMGFNQQGVSGCVSADYTAYNPPTTTATYLTTNTNILCKIFFWVDN